MNAFPALLAAAKNGTLVALPPNEQPPTPVPWLPSEPAKRIALLANDGPTSLGKEIRSLRIDLDLTPDEAGRALGIRATSFILLEGGSFTLSYGEQERAFILLRAAGEAKRAVERAGRVGG